MDIKNLITTANLALIVALLLFSCGFVEETDFIPAGVGRYLVQSWVFDNAVDYTYESGIEVSGGYAQLISDFFDANWQYRQPVLVDNSGGSSSLADYQIRVVLDSANTDFWNNIESDGRSIRFTDEDKSTILDYFSDYFDYGSETAILYVKVPLIPAGSSKTIYLYYGNSSATSTSNGTNTFFFFDDFESGDLGWQQYLSGSVAVISDSGNQVLRKYGNSDANGGYRTLTSSISSYEAIFRTKRVDFTGGGANRYALEDSSFSGYGPQLNNFDAVSTMLIEERSSGSASTISSIINPSLLSNVWYTILLRRYGNTVELEIYDNSGMQLDSLSASDSTVSSFDRFVVHGGYEYYTDDIRIRQYSSPDPGISFGAQETYLPSNNPSIMPLVGQPYSELYEFSHIEGAGTTGNIRYQISNNGTNWYWWDGGSWAVGAGFAQTNTQAEINTNITVFASTVGTGVIYFKAFLNSNGFQEVQVDQVQLGYR